MSNHPEIPDSCQGAPSSEIVTLVPYLENAREYSTEPDREAWETWRELVNMSRSQLERFLDEYGAVAGLSPAEARALGIASGRSSAEWLLFMIPTGRRSFTQASREWSGVGVVDGRRQRLERAWSWLRRQNAFIARKRGQAAVTTRNPYYRQYGEPTRLLLSLLLWGHDPDRFDLDRTTPLLLR